MHRENPGDIPPENYPPQFSNFLYGDNLRRCISRNRIALSCGGRLTVPYCRHYHDGNKRVKYYRRRWACGESGRCIYDGRSAWVPTCRYQIAAKRDRKPLCHWHATRVIIFTKSMPRATRPAPPDTKNIVAQTVGSLIRHSSSSLYCRAQASHRYSFDPVWIGSTYLEADRCWWLQFDARDDR